MRKILLSILLGGLCSLLAAQQTLTNSDIIKLVKSGLSDDFILSTISNQPGSFDASPDAIIALKNAGASDRVMTAIVQKVNGSAPAAPAPAPQPAPATNPNPPPPPAATPASPTSIAVAAPSANAAEPTEKPRVFITDSESWESSGSAGGSNGSFAAQMHGGARPQTAEIIKTFGQRCSEVIVNNKQAIADYIVVLDHEGGKGYLRHRNKVAVFEHESGDVVMSKSTLSLGGSVEEACNGIIVHWALHAKDILAARQSNIASPPLPTAGSPLQPAPPLQSATAASVVIDTTPAGADIEIDGAFVGNAPSTISVAPGSHRIVIAKKGFTAWTKTLAVTGGSVHLSAVLDAEPARQ